MRGWIVAAAILLVAAAAVIALAGGGDDATPAAADASERAERLCQASSRQLAAIPPPEDLRELAETSISTSAITAELADDLREVRFGRADRPGFERLVASIDEQARLMRGVQRAVLAGQRREALRLVRRGEGAERRTTARATALDLPSCAAPVDR